MGDRETLAGVCDRVVAEHWEWLERARNGNRTAFGYLALQVMKVTRGSETLEDILGGLRDALHREEEWYAEQ